MAQYLRSKAQVKILALIFSFTATLCGWSNASLAQWDPGAMLATKTDWFAHQCYLANQPKLKAVTFMAVGDDKLFQFIIQDNDMMTASYDLDHKNGVWKVAGEQAAGRGDEIKKEIYRLNFRLVTSKQFNEIIKTQPKEACKS